MLIIIRDEKNNPIKIEFQSGIYKSFDNLKFVAEQRKPVNVVKIFLQSYLNGKVREELYHDEQRYAELLNSNTKTVTETETIQVPNPETGELEEQQVTHEYTILDLDNIPDEVKQLEEKWPHLKTFRETGVYEEPQFTLDQVEVTDKERNLIKEYNRWYHEDYILSQGYQPSGYDFKVYCKFSDLSLVQNAINLAEAQNATTFPYVIKGGAVKVLSIDEAKTIVKEAGLYASQVFSRKVYIREAYIKPAKTGQDLINAVEQIETLPLDQVEKKLNELLNDTSTTTDSTTTTDTTTTDSNTTTTS